MIDNDLLSDFGSSPLTRGTHWTKKMSNRHTRFIPAYAGNSESKVQEQFADAVHPRLRGELQIPF